MGCGFTFWDNSHRAKQDQQVDNGIKYLNCINNGSHRSTLWWVEYKLYCMTLFFPRRSSKEYSSLVAATITLLWWYSIKSFNHHHIIRENGMIQSMSPWLVPPWFNQFNEWFNSPLFRPYHHFLTTKCSNQWPLGVPFGQAVHSKQWLFIPILLFPKVNK